MVIHTPLLSRGNQVQWHAETIMVIRTPRHPEIIESDGTWR